MLKQQPSLSAWAHRADTLLPPEEKRQDPCLFGLAPCGVYPAAVITGRAVRSYRTFSPLPQERADSPRRINNLRRFILCCTCRPAALKRPSRTLSGTLPCGVRTFLPRPTPCGLSLTVRAAAIIQPPAPSVYRTAGTNLRQNAYKTPSPTSRQHGPADTLNRTE